MRPTNMPRQQLGQIMTPDGGGTLEDSGLANCRRCVPPRVIAWQWVLAGDFETWSGAYPRQAARKLWVSEKFLSLPVNLIKIPKNHHPKNFQQKSPPNAFINCSS